MKVLDYTTGLYTLALKMVFSLQIENPLLSLIPHNFEEEDVHVSWDLRCRKIDSSQKYSLLKIKKPGFLFRILKANKIVHYFLAM